MDESKELKQIDASGEVNNFMPTLFSQRYEMAKILCQSKLLPAGFDTPEKVVTALQMGYELGLSPMVALNNIAVVNGRPTLTTDIMLAIVRKNKEFAGLTWKESDQKRATVEICRQHGGIIEKYISTFTIEEAAAAGLVNKDNWKKYPTRMLKKRALSFVLRDAFPDILSGLYDPDEIEPVPSAGPGKEKIINITNFSETEKKENKLAGEKLQGNEKNETASIQKFDELTDLY